MSRRVWLALRLLLLCVVAAGGGGGVVVEAGGGDGGAGTQQALNASDRCVSDDNVQYFVGICVPNSCREEEVQNLVIYDTFQVGETSLIPSLPSILVSQSVQGIFMTQCTSDTVTPDLSAVTCLFMCCAMVAVPLAATLFTALIRWQQRSAPLAANHSSAHLYGSMTAHSAPSGRNDMTSSVHELGHSRPEEEEEEEETG
ncbi:hypothetical protein CRUP_001603 [Coryphaenoides rupestris]|nr:hypothetical protein CRUP_001603 [Coryphaenoides rupestris]